MDEFLIFLGGYCLATILILALLIVSFNTSDEIGGFWVIPRFVRVDAEEEIGKWYFPLEPGIDWFCHKSILRTNNSIEGCFLDGDCPGNKVHVCKVVLAECPAGQGYEEDEECFSEIYHYYPICFDKESCEDYLIKEVFRIYNETCSGGRC